MQVPFKVDATWTNVVSYESPRFHLLEFVQKGNSVGHGVVRTFGTNEWSKFLASAGDLASLGVNVTTNKPLDHFEGHWRRSFW